MKTIKAAVLVICCLLITAVACTDEPDYENRANWSVQFVTDVGSPETSEIIELSDPWKALTVKFTYQFGGPDTILPLPAGIPLFKGEKNDYYKIECSNIWLDEDSDGRHEYNVIGLRDRGQYLLCYMVIRNVAKPGVTDEKYTLHIYAEVV